MIYLNSFWRLRFKSISDFYINHVQEEAEWNAMLESSRAVAEGAANAAATAAPADAQPADGPASADAAAQPDAPIGEGDVRPDAEGAALGSNAGQGETPMLLHLCLVCSL